MIAILALGFVLLFLGGVPIVFAMLAAAIGALSFGGSMPIELVAQRVVNGLDNFTFLAIPMFVLAGLGGAWVPLEVTGGVFQAIGHVSPIAWALDGFKNIIVRGLGVESVLLSAAALIGYAILFFGLATWRFRVAEER